MKKLHSMTPKHKPLHIQKQDIEKMKSTQQIMHHIIGVNPALTRPPYGSKSGLTTDVQTQVLQSGFHVLDWKLTSLPLSQSVPKIVENVVSHATENIEVVFMRDIHPQSVAAVFEIYYEK